MSSPLTLVSAGPGTGKTLTVAMWARSRDAPWPIAWLTFDASDNTVQSFWTSLLFALSTCDGIPDDSGLQDIAPTTSFGPVEVLTVRARLAKLSRPIVLVLDDFHEITDKDALSSFGELIDHLPECLRVVLVSRSDPALRLHRLRARGELTEIRTADLAFSQRETAALFEQAGISLSTDQATALRERTEGWAVGLRLAALYVDRDDIEPVSTTFPVATRQSLIT